MLTLETTVTSLTVVTQSKVFCWTQAIEPASRSRGLQWAEWTLELQTKVREDFKSASQFHVYLTAHLA